MKTKIKKSWILIALFILANIGIFVLFARHLETTVAAYTMYGL